MENSFIIYNFIYLKYHALKNYKSQCHIGGRVDVLDDFWEYIGAEAVLRLAFLCIQFRVSY